MSTQDPILTISVAARLLKLHPRTLMIYEKAGIAIPHRTSTGRRLYSIKHLDHLQFVKYLAQEKGVNLSGASLVLKSIEIAESHDIDLKKALFPDFKLKKLV